MKQPPRVIYQGEPKKNSWCRWTTFRVKRRNNSTNVRFVGDTGSGKSWSALYFMEMCAIMLGKKIFCAEDLKKYHIYLCFSIKDVLDIIANDSPPPGSIFFIDEQQVEAAASDHQSKRARAYAFLLSTVRSKRYIIITTLPFADMELKKVRRFFQVEIECHGANLSTKTVRSTPRFIEYSRTKKDKTYRKMLIISFTDQKTGIKKSRKLSYWDIQKPSDWLIQIYESMKAQFQSRLYKKLSKELAEDEVDKDTVPKAQASDNVLQTLTEYQKSIYDLYCQGVKVQKIINEKLIEQGHNSTKEKVSQNIKWMRKKGVIIIK
jgi:hypothetical protein